MKTYMKYLRSAVISLKGFRAAEAGSSLPLHILSILPFAAIAGIAIDSSYAVNVQTRLQTSADAAAHAAAIYIQDQTLATQTAINVANNSFNANINGNVLAAADVEFGDWDAETSTFTVNTVNPGAVRVITRQDGGDGGSKKLATFLLGLAGQDEFSLVAESIFVSKQTQCLGSALITDGEMDFDFNFSVEEGFCLYGQTYKMKNAGNQTFISIDSESVIAAPTEAELDDLRNMNNQSAVSIDGELLEYTYDVPFYDITDCIITRFRDPYNPIQPGYITDMNVNIITPAMLINPRIGEDPNNPNDGPGNFINPPVWGGDNSIPESALDGCPQGAGSGTVTSGDHYDVGTSTSDVDCHMERYRNYDPASSALCDTNVFDETRNRIFVDPSLLKPNAVNIIQCNSESEWVVIDSGVELSQMVLISECGWAFCGPGELDNGSGNEEVQNQVLCRPHDHDEADPSLAGDPLIPEIDSPFLHDIVLLAEGNHKNTIYAKYGLRAGRPDDCAPGGGVLMVSNGSIRVHGYYYMDDVQAIAPEDIHWHQKVYAKGGLTIAGTKIHAMRNWLSRYVGCPGETDLFFEGGQKDTRLVR